MWPQGCRGRMAPWATTVLIVDDHADFRVFARALLEAGGFDVVGEAGDGASALTAARALKPALVLLDVQLPDIDGFAVCEQLSGDDDAPVIVLTSSRDASSYRRRLGESSARGFIAKAELSGRGLASFAAPCSAAVRRLRVALASPASPSGSRPSGRLTTRASSRRAVADLLSAGRCWGAGCSPGTPRRRPRRAAAGGDGSRLAARQPVPAALLPHRGPLVHLLLAYPSGRLTRRPARGRRRGVPRRRDRAAGPRPRRSRSRSTPRSRRGARRVSARDRPAAAGARRPDRRGAGDRRRARRSAPSRGSPAGMRADATLWPTSRAHRDRARPARRPAARPLVGGRGDRSRRRPRRPVGAGHAARPARARPRRSLAAARLPAGR